MKTFTKILAGSAGLAAIAAATPAAAQAYGYSPYAQNPYAYNQYGTQYAQPYGQYAQPYGQSYGYAANTQLATQRCTAAVQSRMANRTSLGSILGAVLGANIVPQARVVSIIEVRPRQNSVRVRGLASSGRSAYNNGYGQYGVGAYGAVGYAYQPDLSFSCNVDYRGYVRDVDIRRR
jgi:hypothetical protein